MPRKIATPHPANSEIRATIAEFLRHRIRRERLTHEETTPRQELMQLVADQLKTENRVEFPPGILPRDMAPNIAAAYVLDGEELTALKRR